MFARHIRVIIHTVRRGRFVNEKPGQQEDGRKGNAPFPPVLPQIISQTAEHDPSLACSQKLVAPVLPERARPRAQPCGQTKNLRVPNPVVPTPPVAAVCGRRAPPTPEVRHLRNLPDFGLWTLDFGLWTLDFGLWTPPISPILIILFILSKNPPAEMPKSVFHLCPSVAKIGP